MKRWLILPVFSIFACTAVRPTHSGVQPPTTPEREYLLLFNPAGEEKRYLVMLQTLQRHSQIMGLQTVSQSSLHDGIQTLHLFIATTTPATLQKIKNELAECPGFLQLKEVNL